MSFALASRAKDASKAFKYGAAALGAVSVSAFAATLVYWDDMSGAMDNTDIVLHEEEDEEDDMEEYEEVVVNQEDVEGVGGFLAGCGFLWCAWEVVVNDWTPVADFWDWIDGLEQGSPPAW